MGSDPDGCTGDLHVSIGLFFTLLILPACFLLTSLLRQKSWLASAMLLILYVAAGILGGTNQKGQGWTALLAVPRLYALILFCVFTCALLIRQEPRKSSKLNRPVWAVALSIVLVFSIAFNLHNQRDLYADYLWRIAAPNDTYMAVQPSAQEDNVLFIAMLGDGYHSALNHLGAVHFSSTSPADYLAVTAANGTRWLEQTAHQSTVTSTLEGWRDIQQAESPVTSFDGKWLAFLREDHGRTRIWIHPLNQSGNTDRPLTPPELNVLEMSFLPTGDLLFAASSGGRPSLFAVDQAGGIRSLGPGEARYPSVSPDGHWLAYSELQGGNWNLWLRNLNNGQSQRLTHAACNNVQPA